MSEGFKGEVPRPVDKNENNKFTGKYDKESVLGRFATIQGTTMGEIVDQALNHVNLDVSL